MEQLLARYGIRIGSDGSKQRIADEPEAGTTTAEGTKPPAGGVAAAAQRGDARTIQFAPRWPISQLSCGFALNLRGLVLHGAYAARPIIRGLSGASVTCLRCVSRQLRDTQALGLAAPTLGWLTFRQQPLPAAQPATCSSFWQKPKTHHASFPKHTSHMISRASS